VVDVHEKLVAAEGLYEPVVQPTSRADRIISAIVDENLSIHRGDPK
jgi:hypothetical protein